MFVLATGGGADGAGADGAGCAGGESLAGKAVAGVEAAGGGSASCGGKLLLLAAIGWGKSSPLAFGGVGVLARRPGPMNGLLTIFGI